MPQSLLPGSRVFWWRRGGRYGEYPHPAEVIAVGVKRIKIVAEDVQRIGDRVVRHVAPHSLQLVGRYYAKAINQAPAILPSVVPWGRFARLVEIGEDLRAVRQVDIFENGNILSYDRHHWIDDFGILADALINRNDTQGSWGWCEEMEAAEFEDVWETANRSPLRRQQLASPHLSQMGSVPTWFTIKGWHPADPKKKRAKRDAVDDRPRE